MGLDKFSKIATFTVLNLPMNGWQEGSMYAIAFDIVVAEFEQNYEKPYNGAHEEIRTELKVFGFENMLGSVYLYQNCDNGLAAVYRVFNRLAAIDWFKKSVRDIRVFKVEDWSDFTDIVKKS